MTLFLTHLFLPLLLLLVLSNFMAQPANHLARQHAYSGGQARLLVVQEWLTTEWL